MKKTEPSQERLHQLFLYSETDGTLTWNVRPESDFSRVQIANSWNAKCAGRRAGMTHAVNGYVYVCIDRIHYMAHRLVWIMQNGPILEGLVIDHKDGSKANNQIANLRAVSQIENTRNKKKFSNNKSGKTGVRWSSRHGKWRAYGSEHGKFKHIGLFSCIEEAAGAVTAFKSTGGFSARHGL